MSFDIFGALKARYTGADYAFLQEVPNGTGSAKTRSADAMAMSLWPSRGLELHGFEVKVSRADWLKELKEPAKAEAFFGYCDRWWLVVSDPAIVRPNELPKTWGLLIPRGSALAVKVHAPELNPKQMSRAMLAGILRRAMEQLKPKDPMEEMLAKKYQEGVDRGVETQSFYNKRTQEELDRLKKALNDFEEKSGIKIDAWSFGNVGEIVRTIRSKPIVSDLTQQTNRQISHMRQQLEALETLESQLKKYAESTK